MKKIVISLILIFWICPMPSASEKMIYRSLPKESIDHMNKQRSFVKEIVFRYFPSHQVYGDKRDFDLIQKIIDSKIIDKKDPWQLQSLGIVFGDALSDYIDGLSWWEVTDEYGTDPVLRYKLTTLQITAQTMISKRVGDEEEIDVLHMANWLKDFIINKANEYK